MSFVTFFTGKAIQLPIGVRQTGNAVRHTYRVDKNTVAQLENSRE